MYPRFAVLGSGSKANAYVFEWGDFSFLIDNGFSFRELKSRLDQGGFSLEKLRYVFLTHGHDDHVRGVESLCRQTGIPVVHHRSLPMDRYMKGTPVSKSVEPFTEYRIGPLQFLAFPTWHDAPGAVSWYFALGGKRFTLITDTGRTDGDMFTLAGRSDVLFLESNYCDRMLEEGPYPPILKDRIRSDRGHLSNHQSRDFLQSLADAGKQPPMTYLVHLSDKNNTVEKVAETFQDSGLDLGRVQICAKNSYKQGIY